MEYSTVMFSNVLERTGIFSKALELFQLFHEQRTSVLTLRVVAACCEEVCGSWL